ncbi:MAG: esterase-like activity of phytase family protein [Akkermansiaceae bacterium]|nr:esterase-like activity of phytase family protein [Armatimonadota bacterium]
MTPFTRAIGTGTFTAVAVTLGIAVLSSNAHAQLNIGPIGSLQSIGRTELSSVTNLVPGTTFGGTTVGGLSGLTYDRANNRFFALSDDAGSETRGAARFYGLNINLSDDALGDGDVTFTSVTTLKQLGGDNFPTTAPFTIDPEGIALAPDGNSLYVSSEGFRGANTQNPFIRRYDLSGKETDTGQINLPARYNTIGAAADQGPDNNLVFESLAFNASGTRLYTATEGGLRQDGGPATFTTPANSPRANSRIIAFDPTTGNRTAEYLYRTDTIVRQPNAGTFATAGLVDILFTSDTTFLALERSLTTSPNTPSQTNEVRIFQGTLTGAQDISGIDTLGGGVAETIVGVQKTLLFDFNAALFDGAQIRIDNLEALSFGPQLSDGSFSLIVASDDNFSANSPQKNQFFAFRVVIVPEAGTLPLMVGAGCSLLGVAIARRRKGANE